MKIDPANNPITQTDGLIHIGILPKRLRLFAIVVNAVATYLPSLGYWCLLLSAYRRGRDFGRTFHLKRLAWRAYDKGKYPQAAALAAEWLTRSKKYQDMVATPWRFVYGDAIHDANQVLGLTCLRAGQPEEAIAHLLAAGRTPGSCTLNSYGPRLLLPKALIKAGRTDAVIEYLDLLAEFWAVSKDARFTEMERERIWLIKRWKAQVRKGQVPADPLWK